ncbi:MAG TPA: DUF2277 domain-containing protein [Acidimicrobiales bacterium]
MCRNITTLRGLEPPVTTQEIEAAALQFVRKVSGVSSGPLLDSTSFRAAVAGVARVTEQLLGELPPRQRPPRVTPASRRHDA